MQGEIAEILPGARRQAQPAHRSGAAQFGAHGLVFFAGQEEDGLRSHLLSDGKNTRFDGPAEAVNSVQQKRLSSRHIFDGHTSPIFRLRLGKLFTRYSAGYLSSQLAHHPLYIERKWEGKKRFPEGTKRKAISGEPSHWVALPSPCCNVR